MKEKDGKRTHVARRGSSHCHIVVVIHLTGSFIEKNQDRAKNNSHAQAHSNHLTIRLLDALHQQEEKEEEK